MDNTDNIGMARGLTIQAYRRGYAEGILEVVAIMLNSESGEQYKKLQEIVDTMIDTSI